MNNLHNIFSIMEQDVKHTLKETEQMKHPLIELIRYSLHEQEEALAKVLPLLEDKHTPSHTSSLQTESSSSNLSLDKIKPFISRMYQNQEVSEPTVRAWARAVQWMPSFETQYIDDLQGRFKDMHNRLETAGVEMKQQFGSDQIKYVIPAAYTETEVQS